MTLVRKRKREMVDGLIAMHLERYGASGAELVMGEAKFDDPQVITVKLNDGGTRRLTGERTFLNLGTHGSIPAVPGLAESQPLTNIELLELDRLPEHLVVMAGGYVGLEFAQAYRRFGSRITILEHGPHILANEDPDVVSTLTEAFANEGICVIARVWPQYKASTDILMNFTRTAPERNPIPRKKELDVTEQLEPAAHKYHEAL